MTENKVLILILSTRDKRYSDFIEGCTNGWVNKARQNGIRCIFYSGDADENTLENDNLKLKCDDSLSGTAFKLYKALEFIEKSNIEYTHIYRTNLSSFIFIEDFINFANNLNYEFYGGVIGNYNRISILNKFHFISVFFSKFFHFQTIKFASGSGFFLSKNLVNEIINNQNLQFKYIDDVMIGEALHDKYITPIYRYDISDVFPINFDSCCFHVRLKSSKRDIDAARLMQLNNFKRLIDFVETINNNDENRT